MKKLPIGISTFSEIITGGYYYVDKTRFVAKLAGEGKYYFLSRPRRFGKSLFLDTLREAFKGNKDLFAGLYLEKKLGLEKRLSRIYASSWGGVVGKSEVLKQIIREKLREIAQNFSLTIENESIQGSFRDPKVS